jgi:hypothetical protein
LYAKFQQAWGECLVYAAAEFQYKHHLGEPYFVLSTQPHYYSDSVDNWYTFLSGDTIGLAVNYASDAGPDIYAYQALQVFTSKRPAVAAPYMNKAMAHFNTPGSTVSDAKALLISFSGRVESHQIPNSTVYALLNKYKGVYSHWQLMVNCLDNPGSLLHKMFNVIKDKAKKGG